ncbi:MAG: hypothetical protein LBB73_04990, partial [Dysgonamonadaceae bacterium]|nr:hypothetical protein [Dysgonamonadaceae bacterium]
MDTLPSKNKKALLAVLHSAGWVLFIRLTIPAGRPVDDIFFPLITGIEYALLAAYFYLNTFVFVPRLLSKKKTVLFLGITVAAFVLFCFAVPQLVRYCFLHFASERPFGPEIPARRPHFPPPAGD